MRWILLGFGLLLIVGIWWWGTRRSQQAPGNAQLRETSRGSAPEPRTADMRVPEPFIANAAEPAPDVELGLGALSAEAAPVDEAAAGREWGVPPFEPLSIRTADFDEVQIAELSMSALADEPVPDEPVADERVAEEPAPGEYTAAEFAGSPPARAPAPAPPSAPSTHENSDRFPAVAPTPNAVETQRIVTLRVCAMEPALWNGAELLAALDEHGLAYGRYKVFHRKYSDGRTLFCAASLVEPGTFDLARMPGEQYRGITLFAVLPGPADTLQTLDLLIATAAELAHTLRGEVQDAKGMPFSVQQAEALREDVARFHASLSMT